MEHTSNIWPPVKQRGVYLRWRISVCNTITFESLYIGSWFLILWYILTGYGSALYMKVIGSRWKLQGQKGRKSLFRWCNRGGNWWVFLWGQGKLASSLLRRESGKIYYQHQLWRLLRLTYSRRNRTIGFHMWAFKLRFLSATSARYKSLWARCKLAQRGLPNGFLII